MKPDTHLAHGVSDLPAPVSPTRRTARSAAAPAKAGALPTAHGARPPASTDAGVTPPSTPARRRARRAWRLAAWAALPLALALAWAWQDRTSEAHAAVPTTVRVSRATLEDRISALGTLQPLQAVEVGTQVSGLVERLHVQLGDTVRAQQALAEIDPTVLGARVAAGRAGLRSLRAQLQDKLTQAELAQQQLGRNRKLAALDAVAEEAVQGSAATAGSALAQVEALRAQIEQAQAQLGADEAALRLTRIVAPMTGTVVALSVRPGQTLVASQQAPVLLRIADLSRMTVWAQVSEADVPAVQPGMAAEFNTLGLPERRWQGRVRQVLPTPETVNGVVLYQVLFDVDNPDGALKPQMSAQVSFLRARAADALVVPSRALSRKPKTHQAEGDAIDRAEAESAPPSQAMAAASAARSPKPGKGYLVQVIDAQGQPQTRQVRIGLQVEGQAEVLAGLAEGDQVVLDAAAGPAPAKGKSKSTKTGKTGRATETGSAGPIGSSTASGVVGIANTSGLRGIANTSGRLGPMA